MLAILAFVAPVLATQPVSDDPDDPAIWVNHAKPTESRVIGTNKVKAPNGALYVFDLKGRIVQRVTGIDRPNNVDVIQNVFASHMDLAVCTERHAGQLRVFAIDRTGKLRDVTGKTKVANAGKPGVGEPMGIAMWRSPQSKRIFAIVSPKEGPSDGYIEQYELTERAGIVDATFVSRAGRFSGKKEIEALATSRDGRHAWYGDETFGNRSLDLSDHITTGPDVKPWNTDFQGDNEGVDVWERGPKRYVVCTDQIPGASHFSVHREDGTRVGLFSCGSDETDGIAITSENLGPTFPRGLMVVMDSSRKRFLYVSWKDVEKKLGL